MGGRIKGVVIAVLLSSVGCSIKVQPSNPTPVKEVVKELPRETPIVLHRTPYRPSQTAMKVEWNCADTIPTIFENRLYVNHPRTHELEVHEEKHIDQALRFGCETWNRLYATEDAFASAMEAEAICAQMQVSMHERSLSYDAAIEEFGEYFLGYGFVPTLAAAEKEVGRYCPRPSQ